MAGPYQHETDTYTEPIPKAVAELHAADRVRSGDPSTSCATRSWNT